MRNAPIAADRARRTAARGVPVVFLLLATEMNGLSPAWNIAETGLSMARNPANSHPSRFCFIAPGHSAGILAVTRTADCPARGGRLRNIYGAGRMFTVH